MPRSITCRNCGEEFADSNRGRRRHYSSRRSCSIWANAEGQRTIDILRQAREEAWGGEVVPVTPNRYVETEHSLADDFHKPQPGDYDMGDGELPASPSVSQQGEPGGPKPPVHGYATVETHPLGDSVLRWEEEPEGLSEDEYAELPGELVNQAQDFLLAEWIANSTHTDAEREAYFQLEKHKRNLPFDNLAGLYAVIDSYTQTPGWTHDVLEERYGDHVEVLHVYMRCPVETTRHLIGLRRLKKYIRYVPEKHFTIALDGNRIQAFGEMWSGNWWWRILPLIRRGGTASPFIVMTDPTQLTAIGGDKLAWPVYGTIGNIAKGIRASPNERAVLLIGYLPVPKLDFIADENLRRQKRWDIYHAAMALILEPLQAAGEEGVEMRCADGGIREMGTPDGYDTEIPERLHRHYVKNPYRQTSGVNATPEMIIRLLRKETWAELCAKLVRAGLIGEKKRRGQEYKDSDEESNDEEDTGVVQLRSHGLTELDGEGVYVRHKERRVHRLSPVLEIADRPTRRRVLGAEIKATHHAPDFIDALHRYLDTINDQLRYQVNENSEFAVFHRFKLHQTRLPFAPLLKLKVDTVRAHPGTLDKYGYTARKPYFDCVLIAMFQQSEGIQPNMTLIKDIEQLGFVQSSNFRSIFVRATRSTSYALNYSTDSLLKRKRQIWSQRSPALAMDTVPLLWFLSTLFEWPVI
ncbi:hypothetical protein BN14_06364 [Rhizoctonia solani AG-1 IB]|uniref:C2H2-type domain-containing protein n=1 Tax=Thanatephorus cucumeris (strain AG1-IB / isolate 7/3/14) TaxID=1108050 RepID=M5C907_THACB|nr:hypothetical protein BN14_06364 [Rhizoctonia solani AG-1 IB]